MHQALRFRKFWGEKAELRRFKDGTIAESTGWALIFLCSLLLVDSKWTTMIKITILFLNLTVWESEQWTRHLILKGIIEYVLLRHLSLSKENVVQIVDQLDFSLLHGAKGHTIHCYNICDFWLVVCLFCFPLLWNHIVLQKQCFYFFRSCIVFCKFA